MQVKLSVHYNTGIIWREYYSGQLMDQGIEEVCSSLNSFLFTFRNKRKGEQATVFLPRVTFVFVCFVVDDIEHGFSPPPDHCFYFDYIYRNCFLPLSTFLLSNNNKLTLQALGHQYIMAFLHQWSCTSYMRARNVQSSNPRFYYCTAFASDRNSIVSKSIHHCVIGCTFVRWYASSMPLGYEPRTSASGPSFFFLLSMSTVSRRITRSRQRKDSRGS